MWPLGQILGRVAIIYEQKPLRNPKKARYRLKNKIQRDANTRSDKSFGLHDFDKLNLFYSIFIIFSDFVMI